MVEKLQLTRVDNWQIKLVDHVDNQHRRPFVIGDFDCALWAADCLRIQTGYDIAERWRNQYETIIEGMKLVKKDGFEDHIDVFAQQLVEIPPARAQFGDLVVVEGLDDMNSIGICMGHIIYAPTTTTMGVLHLSQAIRAFRVIKVEGDDEFEA